MWDGLEIAFALVLLYASIAHACWLIAPTTAIVWLAIARHSVGRAAGRR